MNEPSRALASLCCCYPLPPLHADGAAPAAAAAAAGASGPKPAVDEEVLRLRLAQRQKQVDFGKNTIGYQRYSQAKPKG